MLSKYWQVLHSRFQSKKNYLKKMQTLPIFTKHKITFSVSARVAKWQIIYRKNLKIGFHPPRAYGLRAQKSLRVLSRCLDWNLRIFPHLAIFTWICPLDPRYSATKVKVLISFFVWTGDNLATSCTVPGNESICIRRNGIKGLHIRHDHHHHHHHNHDDHHKESFLGIAFVIIMSIAFKAIK